MKRLCNIIRYGKQSVVGLLSASLFLPLATGCEDFVETDSTFFSDNKLDTPSDTLFSVVGVMYELQSLSDRTILLGELRGDLSDVVESATADLQEIAQFNVSDDNMYNAPHDYYAVINNCNYFLAHADTAMKNNRNEYVFRKEYAVMKAYRAWTYLQLALNYGQVPLVTKPIQTQEEANSENYSLMGIQEICNYFISDLQGWENVELPGYGTIRNTDSRLFYFPIYVLLGDLNLWAGNYREAARCYYTYLNTRNGSNVGYPTDVNVVQWSRSDMKWMNRMDGWSLMTFDRETYTANSELITMFPGDSIPSEKQYSRLRDYFNPTANNEYEVSIVPSQGLQELSTSQVYCHFTESSDVVYPPSSLEGTERGDLRLQSVWETMMGTMSSPSNKPLKGISKYDTRNVHLYRQTMVYLRLAEALNRAGFPRFAFQILKTGVNNTVLVNEIIPYYPADAAWLRQFNFPDNRYVLRTAVAGTDENTVGIHSHGSGWSEYNEYYKMPEFPNTADSLAYQIEAVEDLIMDEEALEFAFEGHRFYDLMRVALRRGEPSYLADRVYARRGADRVDEMRAFIAKDLTKEENWYLQWNGELGVVE